MVPTKCDAFWPKFFYRWYDLETSWQLDVQCEAQNKFLCGSNCHYWNWIQGNSEWFKKYFFNCEAVLQVCLSVIMSIMKILSQISPGQPSPGCNNLVWLHHLNRYLINKFNMFEFIFLANHKKSDKKIWKPNWISNCKQALQGQPWQTGFFELALRDRNMQVRFFWKMFLESWDLRNFASATSFYEMHHVRHLRPNLQKFLVPYWILKYYQF